MPHLGFGRCCQRKYIPADCIVYARLRNQKSVFVNKQSSRNALVSRSCFFLSKCSNIFGMEYVLLSFMITPCLSSRSTCFFSNLFSARNHLSFHKRVFGIRIDPRQNSSKPVSQDSPCVLRYSSSSSRYATFPTSVFGSSSRTSKPRGSAYLAIYFLQFSRMSASSSSLSS